MPVESAHPNYTAYQSHWLKCRHAIEGEEAVKGQGETYLPKLGKQTAEQYKAYVMRASFYGAAQRTVEGLAGAVTRKTPQLDGWPEGQKDILTRIGGEGIDYQLLAKQAVEELLGPGRIGFYVDAPPMPKDANGNTVPGQPDPYIAMYYAENVVNWREDVIMVEGKPTKRLTMVVLKECRHVTDPNDPFVMRVEDQYRVLSIVDGVYTVTLWVKRGDKDAPSQGVAGSKASAFKIADGYPITPKQNGGTTLDYIPFVFVNSKNVTSEIVKPPLLALVNVNLSHYRTSADLEHGRHFTALPTAWMAGFDPKQEWLIGSAAAWVSETPQAQCGFLEFTGAGLGSLQAALDAKEKQMAVLGGRLLEQQQKDIEATETVQLRQSGEQSVLAGIADTAGQGLTVALKWVLEWLKGGDSSKVNLVLNKSFTIRTMDPAKLTAMLTALQSGKLSFATWYHNLEQAEMFPDGWTEDKEREEIEKGDPMAPPGEDVPPDAGDGSNGDGQSSDGSGNTGKGSSGGGQQQGGQAPPTLKIVHSVG